MLNQNGQTTTKERDSFRFEVFQVPGRDTWLTQWDYRDKGGVLHSGVAKSIDAAREKARAFGYTGN